MQKVYLLDTNIISEKEKFCPDEKVDAKIDAYKNISAISSITWSELVYGLENMPNGKRKEKVEAFIEMVIKPSYEIIPFDEHAASIFGDLRNRLEKSGRTKPILDLQIAATAIANNMILVTRNMKDFEDIPLLMVENWFEEE